MWFPDGIEIEEVARAANQEVDDLIVKVQTICD
jgi:hypothetical protein